MKNTHIGQAGIWIKKNIQDAQFAQLPACQKLIDQWKIMYNPSPEQLAVIEDEYRNRSQQLGVYPLINIKFN